MLQILNYALCVKLCGENKERNMNKLRVMKWNETNTGVSKEARKQHIICTDDTHFSLLFDCELLPMSPSD